MDKTLMAALAAEFDGHVKSKKDVTRKKMFGCDSYYRGEVIFGLIWKEGRIGVKLTDAAAHEELAGVSGVSPWKAGNKVMKHWLLLPKDADAALAKAWIAKAYAKAQ